MNRAEIVRAAKVAGESDPRILKVVLYGSYARGEQNIDSDVDLALFIKKDFSKTGHQQTEIEALTSRCLENAGFKVHGEAEAVHTFAILQNLFEMARVKGTSDTVVQTILRDGVVLWRRE